MPIAGDEDLAARFDALIGSAKPKVAKPLSDEELAARFDALLPRETNPLEWIAGSALEGAANLFGQGKILSEKLNRALGSDAPSQIFGPAESGLRGAAESVDPVASRGRGGLVEDLLRTGGAMIPTVASAAAGGPLIGAYAFGAQEGVPLYYEIKAKTGDEEAATWGLVGGNAIGQLEKLGAEKALGGIIKKLSSKAGLGKALADESTKYMLGLGGLTEAGTEAVQTGLSDLVYETLTGDDINNWENIKRSIPPSLILGEGFHALDAAIQRGPSRQAAPDAPGAAQAPAAAQDATQPAVAPAVTPEAVAAQPAPVPPAGPALPPAEVSMLGEGGERGLVPLESGHPAGQATGQDVPQVVAGQVLTADTAQDKNAYVEPGSPSGTEQAMSGQTPEPAPAPEPTPAQPEPVATPAEQPAPSAEVPTPPAQESAKLTPPETAPEPEPQKASGIKNATVEAELKKIGLEPPSGPDRTTFVDLHAKAMERMKSDPHAGSKLVEELSQNRRTPSGEEAALLSLENTRLISEREAAEEAFIANPTAESKARVEKAKADYAKAADTLKRVGSEAGISLAARKMMVNRDYSLAAMERSLQVAKSGAPLTEQESKKVSDLHRRMVAAEKALEAHEKGAAERVAGLEARIADLEAKAEAAPKTPRNAKKRASIAESKKRINEILDQLGGSQKAAAGLDLEKVKLVGELAYHGVKLGYNSFSVWADDMVARAGESIRPYLRQAWDDANAKQDEESLSRYKSRKKGDIKRLKERAEAGAFDEAKRTTPIGKDPEAMHLRVEYEKARREFEQLKAKKIEEGKTKAEKAAGIVKDVLFDVERAYFSAFDLSAVMRQGGPLTKAYPLRSMKHAKTMLKAFASHDAAIAADLEIQKHKHYDLARAAGLEQTSADGIGPQEEARRSSLADLIPGVQPSNRAFATYSNVHRMEAFGRLIDSLGHEPTLEEATAIAEVVNNLTGRSTGRGRSIANGLEKAKVFYAPSYVISRFQALGRPLTMLADKRLSWKAKREIGKVYARWAGGQAVYYALTRGAIAAGIASLSGTDDRELEVETNPTSSDFGKIRIGKTRWDVLGGFGQIGVFLSRMALGESKSVKKKKVTDLGDPKSRYDPTYASVLTRFLRSKLSPAAARIVDARTGETFGGEETTPAGALLRAPQLGALRDAYEAMKDLGLPSGVILGTFALLGDSIMVYDDKEKASK